MNLFTPNKTLQIPTLNDSNFSFCIYTTLYIYTYVIQLIAEKYTFLKLLHSIISILQVYIYHLIYFVH